MKTAAQKSVAAFKGWVTRSERDEAVTVNLEPSTVGLWHATKAAFKGTAQERAEQFAEYCEEHPSEVLESLQDSADDEVARLVALHGH